MQADVQYVFVYRTIVDAIERMLGVNIARAAQAHPKPPIPVSVQPLLWSVLASYSCLNFYYA